MAVLDHMRERFAGLNLAREGQEHRTGGVFQFGIGHHHVENRLGAGCDLIPHPQRVEQPAAGRNDRGGARIAARPHRQRRIGHDHANIGTKALAQRQCQRQPGKGAAADNNASLCRHAEPASRSS
jgi:hypothetical protein